MVKVEDTTGVGNPFQTRTIRELLYLCTRRDSPCTLAALMVRGFLTLTTTRAYITR